MSARAVARRVLLAAALLGALVACGPGDQGAEPAVSDTPSSSADKSTVPPTPADSEGAGSVWPGRLASGGVALLLGVGLGIALGRRSRPTRLDSATGPAEAAARSTPAARPVEATPVPSAQPPDQALVDGLLAVADLADSPAVQAQVRATLQRVGVVELPTTPGQQFDPGRHHAVGSVPTADPGRDMTIARVVRGGWTTSAAVIRPADVEVSRHPVVR